MSDCGLPDRGRLLEMAGSFREACVLGAAAELALFDAVAGENLTAEEIAEDLRAAGFVDPRLAVKADDMNAIVTADKL